MSIILPAEITGYATIGDGPRLHVGKPSRTAYPSDPTPSAYALGMHTIALPTGWTLTAAEIDGHQVAFASDAKGRSIMLLADTASGIVEVRGLSPAQLDEVRRDHLDGLGLRAPAKAAPSRSEIERLAALANGE